MALLHGNGGRKPGPCRRVAFCYNAELGEQDTYDADEPDPFFNIPARRAMIPGKCDIPVGVFDDPGAQIRDAGRQFYVTVRVFGTASGITRIRIGDGNEQRQKRSAA